MTMSLPKLSKIGNVPPSDETILSKIKKNKKYIYIYTKTSRKKRKTKNKNKNKIPRGGKLKKKKSFV
jgi:hypothetical protein